jgi:predicted RNA binding protein YcfA (HicA-like mRNA interferase family)
LSKLAPVSRKELIRNLRTLGFKGPYPGSSHAYMVKARTEGGRLYVSIPNPHHGEEIGVGLLVEILRKAKISREEWFSVA